MLYFCFHPSARIKQSIPTGKYNTTFVGLTTQENAAIVSAFDMESDLFVFVLSFGRKKYSAHAVVVKSSELVSSRVAV
jgi:hypothetical protein